MIEGKNGQVRAFGEPRETRQNKKESKKGAAPLEPPCTPRVLRAASLLEPSSTSRTPRLLAYSSPVPKILPLTLLPPAQEEVEVLHPVRQEGLERRALLEGQPKDRLGVEQQLDEQKPLERQFMERRLQELRLQASRLSGRELCSSSPVSNLFIYQARGV